MTKVQIVEVVWLAFNLLCMDLMVAVDSFPPTEMLLVLAIAGGAIFSLPSRVLIPMGLL